MNPDSAIKVKQLFYYPCKSTHEIQVEEVTVTKLGIPLDRIFVIARKKMNLYMSMKSHPQLYYIETKVNGNIAEVTVPSDTGSHVYTLDLTAPYKNEDVFTVEISTSKGKGVSLSEDLNKAISAYLKVEVRFLYCIERRALKDHFRYKIMENARDDDELYFNYSAPIHIITEESLKYLNDNLEKKNEKPLTTLHFRPNIVLEGGPKEFWEDGVKKLKINNVIFRFVKKTNRCKVITYDYEDKKQKENEEPLPTLTDMKWDPVQESSVFGNNYFIDIVDDAESGVIKVSDTVEIIE